MKKFLQAITLIVLLGSTAYAQTEISGFIYDADGIPVPGAIITILNTTTTVQADPDGLFTLTAQQLPITLTITALGLKDQTVQVSPDTPLPLQITLAEVFDTQVSEVVITSRRRKENAQDVPIPISVISGRLANDAGAFNVNRIKELVPSVQLYSSNPRNTGLSIRGLGTTFGLTNDGID
ncbi:MAG: carboxypeptidase regulatory-like domain-containing protein, partial [Bacteroidota bacterium]